MSFSEIFPQGEENCKMELPIWAPVAGVFYLIIYSRIFVMDIVGG